MGTRVEQSGELVPRTYRAGCRHFEDLADSVHRLSPAAEDLQVIIPRCNRALLLQGEFWITLDAFLGAQLVFFSYYGPLTPPAPRGAREFASAFQAKLVEVMGIDKSASAK